MPTPVVMPQMGESVTEGTVVRWIRQVGDTVDRDEPLFEISTDKVDAEIPSPAAGVLLEIRVKEGETVDVDTVVAVLGSDGEGAADAEPAAGAPPTPTVQPDGSPRGVSQPAATSTVVAAADATPPTSPDSDDPEAARAARRRTRSSPLVRNIAAEHGVDLARVSGTGVSGRVTKQDILGYLDH